MSEQFKAFQREIGTTEDGGFGPDSMKHAMDHFKWTLPQAAIFFGNTAHETGDFTAFSENLNYRWQVLRKQWPSHFQTDAIAQAYEHQPVKIANRAYANRMGNGDENSGDGWRFRGRGAIQTTFHDNYQATANYLNRPDIMTNPDLLAGELAMDAARAFFAINHLWEQCTDLKDSTITRLRSLLNTGKPNTPPARIIGLDDVMFRTHKYAGWFS